MTELCSVQYFYFKIRFLNLYRICVATVCAHSLASNQSQVIQHQISLLGMPLLLLQASVCSNKYILNGSL